MMIIFGEQPWYFVASIAEVQIQKEGGRSGQALTTSPRDLRETPGIHAWESTYPD